MTPVFDPMWLEANQRALIAELGRIRALLGDDSANTVSDSPGDAVPSEPPPALAILCEAFDLSPFERELLLLCAGVELDSGFADACAAAHGDASRHLPTFGLALAALPEAHWSALAPDAPLRRWRMIEVGAGMSLTDAPLRIDERVLHHLTGVQHLDERLAGIVDRAMVSPDLSEKQQVVAGRAAEVWQERQDGARLPVIQLQGRDQAAVRAVAAASCSALGLDLHVAHASSLPGDPRDQASLARLWEREAVLSGSALLVEADEVESADRRHVLTTFLERTSAALFLSAASRWILPHRDFVALDIPPASYDERRRVWREALNVGEERLNGSVDRLAAQFELTPARIRAACAEAGAGAASEVETLERAWEAGRRQARPRLEDLAQRLEPLAGWEDLVLPPEQVASLQEIALHVEHRAKVYGDWGFAAKSARGLGISALFSGPSGTGKTLAAEVLANALRLDLFRIDLSQVVNKYIGETEKNLRRVFDAAEEGGAVLFFDEADALFGKRSEVKDSHDRYANVEISYLLQRMEAYRGLAILATNMKDALDPAFLRRIRFVVHFPFPDAALRAEIWRRIFPRETPTEGLDLQALARLNASGGNIRNIAMNAAFMAAAEGGAVRMVHLARAASGEYAKLEKSVTEAELAGWGQRSLNYVTGGSQV